MIETSADFNLMQGGTQERAELRNSISNMNDFRAGLNIPQLVNVLEKALAVCESHLEILGEPNENEADHREHLTNVSVRFHELMKEALRGSYNDQLTEDSFEATTAVQCLRPQLRKVLDSFEEHIRRYGHRYTVMNTLSWGCTNHIDFKFTKKDPSNNAADLPVHVKPETIIKDISDHIERVKGEGLSASHVTNGLIHAQCSPWQQYAQVFITQAFIIVRDRVNGALYKCAPLHVVKAISAQITTPYLEAKWSEMTQKLSELLRPYRTMHLVTLNQTELDAALEKWRYHRGSMECMATDATSTAALEVLDHAWAYYDVALNHFIDNFGNLIVESCLINGLEELFSPSSVAAIDADTVKQLNLGLPSVVEARMENIKGRKVIGEMLSVLRPYVDESSAYLRHIVQAYKISNESLANGPNDSASLPVRLHEPNGY